MIRAPNIIPMNIGLYQRLKHYIIRRLKIMDLTHMDNGTYLCHGENEYDIDVAILHNLVLDKPRVNIHKVVPVATDKIYFNWTVTDWNSPVTDYFLSVRAFC